MRAALLITVLATIAGFTAFRLAHSPTKVAGAKALADTPVTKPAKKPDFDSEIKPIFQARCQPCHFPGGKVYDKLPFDKPETITKLGPKIFTRIKDEKEQRLIREFLAAQ
jgi:hypothetical protein